jgi:hypothetical protein
VALENGLKKQDWTLIGKEDETAGQGFDPAVAGKTFAV